MLHKIYSVCRSKKTNYCSLSVNMKSYKYILPSREAVTGEKSDTAENTWTSTHIQAHSPDTCHLPDKKDELPIVLQAVGTHSISFSWEYHWSQLKRWSKTCTLKCDALRQIPQLIYESASVSKLRQILCIAISFRTTELPVTGRWASGSHL